jgi:hypothetical protein
MASPFHLIQGSRWGPERAPPTGPATMLIRTQKSRPRRSDSSRAPRCGRCRSRRPGRRTWRRLRCRRRGRWWRWRWTSCCPGDHDVAAARSRGIVIDHQRRGDGAASGIRVLHAGRLGLEVNRIGHRCGGASHADHGHDAGHQRSLPNDSDHAALSSVPRGDEAQCRYHSDTSICNQLNTVECQLSLTPAMTAKIARVCRTKTINPAT